MSGARLLVVEDDEPTRHAVAVNLDGNGYLVDEAGNAREAFARWDAVRPDAIVLDLGLPDQDGLTVIRRVRREATTPILILSARGLETDKVAALDAGADDYVTKPFAMDELLARIRALTRRVPGQDAEPVVTFGEVTVDLAARSAERAGERVRLTPTEWKVLELLLRNPGRLVTRQTLLTEIWGSEHVADTGYLRLYLAQLRRKLEVDPTQPRHLLTESGMGYRFAPEG